MGLPTDKVGVANLALDYLGQPRVSNIEPGVTATEILIARNFDDVRQNTLRKYVWNFAKKRILISRVADTDPLAPAFDFPDAYTLPDDFVRLLSVSGYSEVTQSTDYDIQGKTLLINASGAATIKCRYIADITDVVQWDASFRRVMALHLALAIGFQITKKDKILARIDALLKEELCDAVTIDGQEVPPRRIQRSKYLDARAKGGSSAGSSLPWITDSDFS